MKFLPPTLDFSPFRRKIKRVESSRSTRCISLAVAINRITAGASERKEEKRKERRKKKRRKEREEVGVKSVKLRKVVKREVAGIGWRGRGKRFSPVG